MRFSILAPTLALAVVLLHGAIPHEGLHELLAATLSQQLAPTDTLNAQCQEADLSVTSQQRTAILLACGPRYTPTPLADTIEGVPLCTDHDRTRWHPLVKKNAAGAILCTYGHEHHADPNKVNDLFGPPGAWFGASGQSISYPWYTTNASTGAKENDAKHEGYKWFVARNLPCVPADGLPGCVVAYRVQVHARGDVSDAITRFHSFSGEAVLRDPATGRQGIVRTGGHIDIGHLKVLVGGPFGSLLCVDGVGTLPPCSQSAPAGHVSGSLHAPAPRTDVDIDTVGWYAFNRAFTVRPVIEEWGPIDLLDPARQVFSTSTAFRDLNNSRGKTGLSVSNNIATAVGIPISDDLADGRGWVTRDGFPASGCAVPSTDCIPWVSERAPAIVAVLLATGDPAHDAFKEYDVPSPQTGRSLIRFPN